MATWTCTDEPCPWGEELSNPAIAWPVEADPISTRLGYTVSPAVYLPALSANGLTVTIDSGSARVYRGAPQDSSHVRIGLLQAGDSIDVDDLDSDEGLSVQSDDPFTYHYAPTEVIVVPDAGAPDPEGPDAGAPGPDAPPPPPQPDAAVPDAAVPPDVPPNGAQPITLTCTGQQCPWGQTQTTKALVWQVERGAIASNLGYTASAAIYLFGFRANGADIWIDSGTANVIAGLPGDVWPRTLATLHAGETFHVTGVGYGEVISVQSSQSFTHRFTLPPAPPPAGGPPDPNGGPGVVMQAAQSLWRCNIPQCFSSDWTGAVIAWPSGTANTSNARPGNLSRSVFGLDNAPLYPYMGPWAEGCEVIGQSGITRVIEWQRGATTWRDTWLFPGEAHTIHLVPPENGALIEGYDASPGFSAVVRNCTPQSLAP